MAKQPEGADPFAGMNEAKSPTVKWGKVGDWFKGTLVANDRKQQNKLSEKHEIQTVYEFKMHGGSFHGIENRIPVDEATIIGEGTFFNVYGKGAVEGQMRNAKLGQVIGMRFAESKAATQAGRDDTKIIKVFLGEMDATYQGETAADRPPLDAAF